MFGRPLTIDSNESYSLKLVAPEARIRAREIWGVLHALESLIQLTDVTEAPPTLSIHDAPKVPWRGLLIDTARHFFPMFILKRQVEAMAAVKLNVLHWHISDAQSFPLILDEVPELGMLGSHEPAPRVD